MSRISEFLSTINKFSDLARSDRFKVFIYPTGGKLTGILNKSDEIKQGFRCEEAELPGRTLGTADLRTYGPIVKYPTLTSYNDLNLTFLCSANKKGTEKTGLPEKIIFDDWMDLINPSPSFNSNPQITPFWNMNYKTDYTAMIYVQHYDTVENRPTYGVRIEDAFPIAMNQVSLNWGTDSVIRLIVTFSYTRWYRFGSDDITDTSAFARTTRSSAGAGNIMQVTSDVVSTPLGSSVDMTSLRRELYEGAERAVARAAQLQAPGEGPGR